jgi:hypothetical protein
MISDSLFSNGAGLTGGLGDFMTVSGGSLDMQFSQIGVGQPNGTNIGLGDTTHCNFHINSATSITVNNSNIAGSPFGVMQYMQGADFKTNNFYPGATGNVDFEAGEAGTSAIDGSWFADGETGGAGLTGSAVAAPIAAGPR